MNHQGVWLLAAAQHRGLLWGVVLVVLGTMHLIFRRFYVRRNKAVHDARQDTAPAITRPFYRRHGARWYLRWDVWGGIVMILVGLVDVAISA